MASIVLTIAAIVMYTAFVLEARSIARERDAILKRSAH